MKRLAGLSTGSLSIGPVDFTRAILSDYFIYSTRGGILDRGPPLERGENGPTEGAPKGEVGGAMPPQVAPR